MVEKRNQTPLLCLYLHCQGCCGLWLFHPVQRDPDPIYPTHTLMEDSCLPRFSSHPVLTGKGWWRLLGGLDHTHRQNLCWISPIKGHWCLVLTSLLPSSAVSPSKKKQDLNTLKKKVLGCMGSSVC